MRLIGIYGLLGYETAEKLFCQHEEELRQRFSKRFLKNFTELPAQCTFTEPEEMPAMSADTFLYIAPVGEGGLYGTMWNACEELGPKCGCRVELLKVPVRQEVVEICELYDEDPYEVPSKGCFLVIWDSQSGDGSRQSGDGSLIDKKLSIREPSPDWREPSPDCPDWLLSILKESVIIGKLTNDGRRVLEWDDMVRFLTPPQRQKKDIMDRKNEVHTC